MKLTWAERLRTLANRQDTTPNHMELKEIANEIESASVPEVRKTLDEATLVEIFEELKRRYRTVTLAAIDRGGKGGRTHFLDAGQFATAIGMLRRHERRLQEIWDEESKADPGDAPPGTSKPTDRT
jgi:hypothetical protein